MPGIVGFFTKKPRETAEPELARMVEAISYESSYRSGTWIEESLGVYVGWAVRESSSSSEGMPFYSEQKDVVLVFSGEEFPEQGTAQRLKGLGHQLEPDGPSYLVHVSEEDPSFPAGLNGRFQGVLVNRNLGSATLFNDRYGLHRLYYHESGEGFYFAAEAKAILRVVRNLREMDLRGLAEFVTLGCVLEDRTLFRGIRVLPCASAWTFRKGVIEHKKSYFHPREWEEQGVLEAERYYQEVREVFSRNLPRYFLGGQRVGVSLTGGLDSRMVMAWQKGSAGTLPCYTFRGMHRESQDVLIARQVALVCGQPHAMITVGEEFLSHFPRYAERAVYITDGCVDVSHSVDLYVNELAREIAPVRMTGNYGGEVFRRLHAFKPAKLWPGAFQLELLRYVREAERTYAALVQSHPTSFGLFQQTPWHHYGLRALEESQLSQRTPFLDNDFVRTVFRAPEATFADDEIRLRLISDGNADLGRIGTNRGPLRGTLPRSSAMVLRGVHSLLRKAEYAYDYGMPQWFSPIDHLLSPLHLERFFLGRQKFYHFRTWYRDVLSEYVLQILLDPRTLSRPCFAKSQLEGLVRGHIRGDRNYTTAIHKALTIELVHQLFLDT